MRKQVTLSIPVTIRYDDAHSDAAGAVADFYRALEEAEQSGHFERTIIDFTYGMGEPSEPEDSDEPMDLDELECLISDHDDGEHTTSWDGCPVCEEWDNLDDLRTKLGLVEDAAA